MRAASTAASRFSSVSRPWASWFSSAAARSGRRVDLGFQADRRMVVVQRHGQAARRRRGGVGRADEGKQVQQIERRAWAHAQAAERGRGMHQDRRRQGAQQLGGLGRGQHQKLAVRCQDGGAAVARDHGRGVGQRDGSGHSGYVAGITSCHRAAVRTSVKPATASSLPASAAGTASPEFRTPLPRPRAGRHRRRASWRGCPARPGW